jgi:single-stranded DNA-binding protein
MRGINRVIVSGNATGKIDYSTTDQGGDVCTFVLASDRHSSGGVVTAYVKVNVYIEALVRLCRTKLDKGCYILVEGELMNRTTPSGKVTEVRAWELLFLAPNGVAAERSAE